LKPAVPLEPRVEKHLAELGEVDVLVGIPSFNNATTIGHVVTTASLGLARYFPGVRAIIVNSDGGSTDGTRDVVASADALAHQDATAPETLQIAHHLNGVHRIVTPYHGIPGKGSAFRTIFAIAERLKAKACAVVDSDLRSIQPGWFELLLKPILSEGFDYVAPMYLRHKYDGTITNSIVYPLTRALYGKEVRQPIGGEFGFSGRMASHYLGKHVWESNVARFGIDIWMTTTAIADGFKVCQAFLGAKVHDPKDPGADLADMLIQVVSSVFDLMDRHADTWRNVAAAEAVPLFGPSHGVTLEPVAVDVQRMLGIFRHGVRDLREIWEKVLDAETLRQVVALASESDQAFRFPDGVWARVIYDFAVAYHRRLLPGEQLLRSLVPLYLGRTASFVLQAETAGPEDVEVIIRELADEYVRQKDYLRNRWR